MNLIFHAVKFDTSNFWLFSILCETFNLCYGASDSRVLTQSGIDVTINHYDDVDLSATTGIPPLRLSMKGTAPIYATCTLSD
jgi:hypothetical protein